MENEQAPENQSMYFDPPLVKQFSALEQNQKHYLVAKILDLIAKQEFENSYGIMAAELGGGAHPDRYDWLFTRLLTNPKGSLDWVDFSPLMLKEAVGYLDKSGLNSRKEVINFIEADIFDYLKERENRSLNLCLMKYTFEEIREVDLLFSLLSQKLKPQGKVIATIGVLQPAMRSISTNARFLYKGTEFPLNETRILEDGDAYTVKFFKESGNPDAGYLRGAQVTKYFHSPDHLKNLSRYYGFDLYLGDWKKYLIVKPEFNLDQDIMVLSKK